MVAISKKKRKKIQKLKDEPDNSTKIKIVYEDKEAAFNVITCTILKTLVYWGYYGDGYQSV